MSVITRATAQHAETMDGFDGPDHLPLFTAGTELIEFSPAAEFHKTVEAVLGDLAAASAGRS